MWWQIIILINTLFFKWVNLLSKKLLFGVSIPAYLRFGSIEGVRRMSDILRAVKYPEGQSRKKIPWTQVTSDWPQLKPRLPFQKNVNVLKLGDVVLSVSAIFN